MLRLERLLIATVAVAACAVATLGTLVVVATPRCPPASSTALPDAGAVTTAPEATSHVADEAIATYQAMWEAVVAAAASADPDAQPLRAYLSDTALALVVSTIYVYREQHDVILGRIVTQPAADVDDLGPEPTHLTVTDCVDSRFWLVYHATGGLADPRPGGRHATTATVTRTPAGWRVTQLQISAPGTC